MGLSIAYHTYEFLRKRRNDTNQLFKNETIGTYTRCRIVMDEIYPLRARVFGQDTTEVIINVEYDVLIDNDTGKLIIVANKKSCDKISDYISE